MATLDVVVTKRSERAAAQGSGPSGTAEAWSSRNYPGRRDISFTPETTVNRGDILRLGGAQRDVERAGRRWATSSVRPASSDVVFLGLGIVIGGLVGLLTFTVGFR